MWNNHYSLVSRAVSYPSILHQVRQHHDHPTLSLIDHLPEVPACDLHWSLGNDEPLVLLVALCKCTRAETWIQMTQEE